MDRKKKQLDPDFISLLLLLFLGLLAYSNSFLASFHYDDITRIVQNDAILDIGNLRQIYSYCPERFLVYLTLALNYRLSGFDTTSYHIINFFIHYFATIFLYFFCLEIWKTPALKANDQKFPLHVMAFLVAGIFCLHPLQTESVTYIIQRAESMAGMFYWGAMLFYMKARLSASSRTAIGYYLATLLCGLGAAFSKETAITLPIMIVALEVLFFETSIRDVAKNKIIFALFIPIGIAIAYKLAAVVQRDFYYDPDIPYTRTQYFLTQFSVLLTYLRLFFWPANQNLDYDYPVATSFIDFRTVSAFAVLLLFLTLAIICRRKYRCLSFGIIGFFVTLAPTSSVIPIKDLIYEHRMYLAVGFLAMAAVEVVWRLVCREKAPVSALSRVGALTGIALTLLLLSAVTYSRNNVWFTDLTLWRDVVAKSPGKTRPHLNYGMALYKYSFGDLKNAKKEFEIARELCPTCPMPYHNLAFILWKEGDYQGAVRLYQQALQRDPAYEDSLYQLGRLYKNLGQWEDARKQLERLIGLSPGFRFIQAYLDLIEVYQATDLPQEAAELASVISRMPDGLPHIDYHRGLAYFKLYDYQKAEQYLAEAATKDTASSIRVSANLLLAQIYYEENNYQKSEEAFLRVLDDNAWSVTAHYNLALLLERKGRLAEAREHLEKILVVDPFCIDAAVQLVGIYDRLGDAVRRTDMLIKLLGLRPTSREYFYLKAHENADFRNTLRTYSQKFLLL
ncbi:MAG: tetratricopeptide repeat protein [Deltaproteobacteria bacterium]|nr:tetratricopeptide repeat protein [Deltaproteobacteria bacterium]